MAWCSVLALVSITCVVLRTRGDRQASACAKDRRKFHFCMLSIASTHAIIAAVMLEHKETDTRGNKARRNAQKEAASSERSPHALSETKCWLSGNSSLLEQAHVRLHDTSHLTIRSAPRPRPVYQRSAPRVMGPRLQYSSRLTSTRSFSLSYTMRVNLTWMVL